ncbi:hypothetical protein MKX08_008189 [Trichoderma sp. CBMAI-0020]|nr:hypothetical protein MKX08_008189 [Trichoderma sp. CBMAI-0020]WOD46325.1 hypothetical protein [Trichoderma atroviride]
MTRQRYIAGAVKEYIVRRHLLSTIRLTATRQYLYRIYNLLEATIMSPAQESKEVQATTSSKTQAKPYTAEVGRSLGHADDNELYESTQLATQSNSPPEIKPDPSVAKAGDPVDQDKAEDSTQLASSLQSDSCPETKIETPVAKLREDPTDAVDRGGSFAGDNDVEESTQLASSLQSISSSQRKELKSRINEARENLFKEPKRQSTSAPPQDASSVQAQLKYPVVKKEDRSPDEIFVALKRASHLMPEARLVVRSLYSNRANETANYAITHPPAKEAYQHIFGVVQSRNHTDFIFQTPLYLRLPSGASHAMIETKVNCQFIYDPTSDSCLLVNRSVGWEMSLSMSASPSKQIEMRGSHVLHPGMWTILVKGQGSSQHYPALDILIAPRRFNVSIYRETNPLRSKRAIEDDGKLIKRQRLGDGTKEIAVDRPADLTLKELEDSFLHNHIPREFYDKTISPILDLIDGETAVVEDSQAGPVKTKDSYRLQRVRNVVLFRATSVFTCQHSELPGSIVAKVLRYSNNSIYNLIGIARSWKDEQKALSNLHHKNIVSLKAVDGRAFALYLEHLPPSLNAVRESPFDLSDAKTILHDISSALAYLSKQEIIHYDIKPANIAYSPDRGAVLMDFGMADSVATIKQAHGGTPWFVPPDVLDGGIRGFPGDVWALGVTMLLVLEKVALPSSLGQPVYIYQLHNTRSYSHERTKAWFTSIEQCGKG